MASNERKKLKRKEKVQSIEEPIVLSTNTSPKKLKTEDKNPIETNSGATTVTLGWTSDDLNTLINNLAKCLPKNDSAKFSTLVEKLDWDKVKFGSYGAQECKDKWNEVMSRLRRYRTLTDMVSDARVWLKAPWQTYNNAKKIKHPDFPKKPLTPFFRYFMEKREKSGKSHPGASVTDLAKLLSTKFAALNERKKQKYKDAYDREYNEYKQKLVKFKTDHPEVEFGAMNKNQSSHGHAQEGPPKPKTPSQLFMEEKTKKIEPKVEGRKEAIERIKHSWSQLSEGKRIKWIRKSLQDEIRYETQLLEYLKDHPSFEPNNKKNVLTKAEKELKDKFDGKPERPPNSGYSLFSKIMLRELKDIPSKEKMVVIAKRWKELSESERQGYNREANKANTKYVEKFNAYLDSLPEAEKAKVLSENKLKLPSEKKLKAQQNLPKLQTPLNPEAIGDPNAREHAALMNYQLDRAPVLQQKYPEKNRSEIVKLTLQEWRDKLTDKKKAKYYKAAENFAHLVPLANKTDNTSPAKQSNVKEKLSPTAQALLKREPKRPPKSSYALFTSEMLSTLTDFEPKKRMQEIARKWNHEMSKSQKDSYDIRAKQMTAEYQKNLQKFTSSLNASEMVEYQGLQQKSKSKQKGRTKATKSEPDPVVDDSNVITTIDVSTSGNAVDSDDESDDSDNEDEEEEEETQQQPDAETDDSDEDEEEEEDEDGDDSEESDE